MIAHKVCVGEGGGKESGEPISPWTAATATNQVWIGGGRGGGAEAAVAAAAAGCRLEKKINSEGGRRRRKKSAEGAFLI